MKETMMILGTMTIATIIILGFRIRDARKLLQQERRKCDFCGINKGEVDFDGKMYCSQRCMVRAFEQMTTSELLEADKRDRIKRG